MNQVADAASEAVRLRREWMAEMGLGEDEIQDSIRTEPPVSVVDEQAELDAVRRVELITPPASVLSDAALKY